MYRFLLTPRWIVLHLLVLTAVVVMINLGFWQLRRLDEKQARNEAIEARSASAPVPIGELTRPDAPLTVGEELEFTAVVATGTYDPEGQALLRSRDLEGDPGFWVLTPLDLGDGTAVVVNRGWIPFEVETDGSDIAFDTPTEAVTVTGVVERSTGDAIESGDAQATIAHLDLGWFDDHVDADLYPVGIQLLAQDPAPVDDYPVILDAPELTEGPHLSYAVQWFLFSAVAIIGYPILLRRVAEQRARGEGSTEGDIDEVAGPEDEPGPLASVAGSAHG